MTSSHRKQAPWKKGLVGLARRAFPLPVPKSASLPNLTDLAPPEAARVNVPLLTRPDASDNLVCRRPSAQALVVSPSAPEVDDLSERLLQSPHAEDISELLLDALAEFIDVASLFQPLKFPAAQGKTYGPRTGDQSPEPVSLPSEVDLTEKCIHGITRAWCETCSKKKRASTSGKQTAAAPPVNPLDLILPILQPPLGADFDNAVSFAPGQELYDFQRPGVRFLAERRSALLGDEMGLGKSIQAIVALRILFRKGKIRRVLLLCPKSVVYDWYDKFWDWAPELNVLRVRANRDERLRLWSSPAHVYITTYETWREDEARSVRRRFDACILDEIQRIKNPEAGVTKAARRIEADHRWGLSGTPLENKVDDVISIFAFLKPGLLKMADADRTWLVRKRIKPYFLRRRSSDVLDDLPEKVSHEVSLELGRRQRESYERAYSEARGSLMKHRTRMNALARITKLKQICNIDPATGQSAKLEYLKDKLEGLLEQGEKALVFSQYPNKTLRKLKPRLAEYGPVIFDGRLSDAQREDLVSRFQESDDLHVLLMSVRAGSVGLTLTEANHVFHFDMWWNPATAKQAEGRAHRIGQEKTVFVNTLYTVDTIEQRIREILRRKSALFAKVIDDLSVEDVARGLTDGELFGLFDLEPTMPAQPEGGKKWVVRRLRDLTPYEFEELIARLYEQMGFAVRLTPKSHDAGVDIYAKRYSDAGLDSCIIQCKHYLDGVVGTGTVRQLFGVLEADRQAARAVLVTSGRFSQPARQFAYGKNIDLVPLVQLEGLLRKYDLLKDSRG